MYSLYIHIPFCTHRCAYCDFNTYAGYESLIPAYVEALCCEIKYVGSSLSSAMERGSVIDGIHTIFFGGGTPTLLSVSQYERIFQAISNLAELSGGVDLSNVANLETTFEANPGTVTYDSLRNFHRAGFNRISLGVQSFHPDELRQLERNHDPSDVLEAVHWARQAGFNNLNLDLIYGLPEQSLSRWQESLRWAVGLSPEHLSLYALTIEHGTPFGRWADRGWLPIPDPDLAADMYEAASDYLTEEGYEQYEISNWAKPGFQCRHNLQYWRNQPYLGFGAGAHGCAEGLRISNVLRIKTYVERLHTGQTISAYQIPNFPLSPATINQSRLTPRIEMQETMMIGLRLTQEGISASTFRARFGQNLRNVFGKEIDELIRLGLLEWVQTSDVYEISEVLRLTKRGRLLGNQVFLRFVN